MMICYIHGVILAENIVPFDKPLCQRLHWCYRASSIRPRNHRDPCIWSCLGSPQPLLNNITIICPCSSFLPQQSCRGVRRQTAGYAPLPCNQNMRENSQGLVETHAQIDKHTYGVSHTREKKVTTALPPPLLTFLEHLHSLNILAGVEKNASLLSACHVCSLKETRLVLIRAFAKSWGNCHFLFEMSFLFFDSYTLKQSWVELMILEKKKRTSFLSLR